MGEKRELILLITPEGTPEGGLHPPVPEPVGTKPCPVFASSPGVSPQVTGTLQKGESDLREVKKRGRLLLNPATEVNVTNTETSPCASSRGGPRSRHHLGSLCDPNASPRCQSEQTTGNSNSGTLQNNLPVSVKMKNPRGRPRDWSRRWWGRGGGRRTARPGADPGGRRGWE